MKSKKEKRSAGLKIWTYFSLIYAMDLYPTQEKVRRSVLFTMRLSITIFYVYSFISQITSWPSGMVAIVHFQQLWYTFSCFITYWVTQVNSLVMQRTLADFLMLKPDKHVGPTWSIVLITLWLIYFIFDLVTAMVESRINFAEALISCYLGGCWTLFCTLTYSTQIILVSRLNDIFFDHYVKERSESVRSLRILWHQIREIKHRFTNASSLIPLLWMGNIFFKSFSNGVAIRYNVITGSNTFTFILNYWYLAEEIFHVLLIILYTDRVNAKAQDHLLEFRRECLQRERNQELELLYRDIKESILIEITGWSMFTLNKEFVLSFISALISFSILFIQLVGEPEKVV